MHPWESGYDNSPIWDEPMNKVKIEKNIKYKRADNKFVNPEFLDTKEWKHMLEQVMSD